MFCSQCGVEANGKFCFNCGAALVAPDQQATNHADLVVAEVLDWENDVRYENIIREDAVRAVIARHAASAPKGMSGEALLAICDKIVASPVSLEGVAAVAQPLYASLGVRTGKDRAQLIHAPIGRAIARALCSLARHGQTFQSVEQGDCGCVLIADLPSSVCALKGELKISLRQQDLNTQVVAATDIPGQMFDWGKSQRCLENLFNDLNNDLGLPPSKSQQRVA